MGNINNPHTQKLVEVLGNFKVCEGVLWTKSLRTADLKEKQFLWIPECQLK